MHRLMTKDEARLVLDAHLAFTNAGGDRSNEWYANVAADDMDDYYQEPDYLDAKDLDDLVFP